MDRWKFPPRPGDVLSRPWEWKEIDRREATFPGLRDGVIVVVYSNAGQLHAARFDRDNCFYRGDGPWDYRGLRYYRYIASNSGERHPRHVTWGGATPSPTEDVTPAPQEETHSERRFLELHVRTSWDEPVEDESGFELVHPDGRTEEGKLSGGRYRKDGALPGNYRIRFRHIVDSSWSSRKAFAGDHVTLRVITTGFPDGTKAVLKVYPETRAESEGALAELEVSISENVGTTRWHFEQAEGQHPGGTFIFEALIGHNWAASGPLDIVPFPIEELRGVKQRLRQLGYSVGSIDDELDPKTRDALKQLQKSAGIPEPDGNPTELIRAILASLVE